MEALINIAILVAWVIGIHAIAVALEHGLWLGLEKGVELGNNNQKTSG